MIVGLSGKKRYVVMHRLIMRVTDKSVLVDHRDRNTLDNRKRNLRTANRSQNGWNSKIKRTNRSGIKGIYWHAANRKWIAQISIERKHKYLGSFATREEAAAVYEQAASAAYGEFFCMGQNAAGPTIQTS